MLVLTAPESGSNGSGFDAGFNTPHFEGQNGVLKITHQIPVPGSRMVASWYPSSHSGTTMYTDTHADSIGTLAAGDGGSRGEMGSHFGVFGVFRPVYHTPCTRARVQ